MLFITYIEHRIDSKLICSSLNVPHHYIAELLADFRPNQIKSFI